jgi:hypothetical protein
MSRRAQAVISPYETSLILIKPLSKHMPEETPRRQLSKQDATRHLIHAAIRLFINGDDPFIIHMLIQSADKILIDVAKKSGKKLVHDWETFILPEKKNVFLTKYRETYNFFKHSDHDFGKDLPITDIVKFNLITLFVAVQNYFGLYPTFRTAIAQYLLGASLGERATCLDRRRRSVLSVRLETS